MYKLHLKTLSVVALICCCSCKDIKTDTANGDRKTDDFYRSYIKEQLALAGVDQRLATMVTTVPLHLNSTDHEKILTEIDQSIEMIKKLYEDDLKERMDQISVLIATIKAAGLENKEPFYQSLLAAKTDQEKSYLYQMEIKKHMKIADSIKNIEGVAQNIPKLLILQRKYAYLTIIKRDKNGNINELASGYDKTSEVTTIMKYDDLYYQALNDEIDAHKNGKGQQPNSTSSRSIMGIKVY